MLPLLMAQLRDAPQIAEPILRVLGELQPRPDRWIEILLGQLGSRDDRVRAAAANLLGQQKSTAEDVKAWAAAVGRVTADTDGGVRMAAVHALQGAGGLAHDGLDGVLQMVASERDADRRAHAAEAVGDIADAEFAVSAEIKTAMARRALPVLTGVMATDPAPAVRTAAVRSLNMLQLEPGTVLPILVHAAVDGKDASLRLAALRALGNRGRDAASAADAIRPLTRDPDGTVRTEAAKALELMQSSYSGKAAVVSTAAADPASRERGLRYLREHDLKFTEDDFYRLLGELDLEKVTAFLDAGMSPNLRFASEGGNPALRVAVRSPYGCAVSVRPTGAEMKALVKLLLSRGANPKVADDSGNTPLMEAAEKCDGEVVKMLVAGGADMYAKNSMGFTAFELGLVFASDGASALIDAGYRINAEQAKAYREMYAGKPKALDLIARAAKK